jgi:hypothetical protein
MWLQPTVNRPSSRLRAALSVLVDLQSSTSDINGTKVAVIHLYTSDVIGAKWLTHSGQGFPEIGV